MSKYEYGLVGGTLGHSYSPRIHRELGDYKYELLPMDEAAFDAFFTERDFLGVNVTIPYKKKVVPYLDGMTERARAIGSVNTVVCRDGKLCGDNTDYAGFLFMAGRAKIDFAGKKVLVLGDGGASAAVVAAARGAHSREVLTVSRRGTLNYGNVYEQRDADIIVNATPVGMYPNCGERLIDLSRFGCLSGVLDLIYNPLRTALIFDAMERGIPCSSGLPMLVSQAVYANEFFFGRPGPEEKTEEILAQIERDCANIVLVGMPGSGKSTVGRAAAKLLGREFIDTDEEIKKRTGRTPAEIIKSDGEDAFRDIETKITSELGKVGGRVIACGGGVVTRGENYRHLKQNGDVYYIKRDLSLLARGGRPLSAGDGALERLFAARREKYERFADFEIINDATVEDAARRIAQKFASDSLQKQKDNI